MSALSGARVQNIAFQKPAIGNTLTGIWFSNWQFAGNPPAGTMPASNVGAAVDGTNAGAIAFSNPNGSNTLYVANFKTAANKQAVVACYDRIWQATITLATTTTNITGTQAPVRYATATNNQLAIEFNNGLDTNYTVTIGYTNQSGTSGRTCVINTPTSNESNDNMCPVSWGQLQAGDTGVQSVQSHITNDSGDAGYPDNLFMFNPASFFWQGGLANFVTDRDMVLNTQLLPIVQPNACLCLMHMASATAGELIQGTLTLVEG